jgi:hypothetical protein
MARLNEAAVLAEKLVWQLGQLRELGPEAYPITVAQLAARVDVLAAPRLIYQALARKPFAAQLVVACKKDLNSPVALVEDTERLVASSLLLEYALGRICSAEKPLHALNKVAGQVDRPLRPAFEAALQHHLAGALPDSTGSQMVRGKVHLYLKLLPPPPPPRPPAEELSERLLQALHGQRAGGDGYPLTLKQLVEKAGLTPPAALLKKALTLAPFHGQVVLAAKNLDAPLALAEDAGRLADSPLLLEFALELLSSPKKPVHPLAKVAGKVGPSLRPAFEEALHRRHAANDWPASVAAVQIKNQTHLHLKRYPLPRPPAEVLSTQMVQALHAQRARGEAHYPLALQKLVELADGAAAAALVKKALTVEPFRGAAVLTIPNQPGALVALREDRDRVVTDPRLVEMLLAAAHAADNQAIPLTDLARKIAKDLQSPFLAILGQQIDRGALAAGVGCLRIKRKPHLFLLADLTASRPALPKPPAPVVPPAPERLEFLRLFEEAFDRLDRQHGGSNYVNLVDLRQSVPCDRATFDAELRKLRLAGRFTLSGAEGRHGLSPDEQAAGIREGDALLLFVSRKMP